MHMEVLAAPDLGLQLMTLALTATLPRGVTPRGISAQGSKEALMGASDPQQLVREGLSPSTSDMLLLACVHSAGQRRAQQAALSALAACAAVSR